MHAIKWLVTAGVYMKTHRISSSIPVISYIHCVCKAKNLHASVLLKIRKVVLGTRFSYTIHQEEIEHLCRFIVQHPPLSQVPLKLNSFTCMKIIKTNHQLLNKESSGQGHEK